jgi:hypothetical protein
VRNSTGVNIYNLTLAGKVQPSEGWRLMVVTPRPGRLTPGKETQYPFLLEAVWTQIPVTTCVEIVVHDSFRSPDRPARSESLYGQRNPGLLTLVDGI